MKTFVLTLFFLAINIVSARSATPPHDPKIGPVVFFGNTQFSDKELIQVLPFQDHSPYESSQEEAAVQLLVSHYNKHGFLEAKVFAETHIELSSTVVRFFVQEGPQYKFGSTEIKGLEKLPQRIVQFQLAYKQGDFYSTSKLFRTQSDIYGSGFFEDVSIQLTTTTEKTANVKIQLKERPFKWVKGGVGWGSEERQRFTLILTHDNFLRQGYRTELTGTVSEIWEEYKFEFLNRYLFGTRTEERAIASWRSEDREGYNLERLRIENHFGRRLTDFIRGSINYRIDRNIVVDLDPEIAATTPDRSDTRALNLALNRDTADDLFYPKYGTRSDLVLERAGGILGGINNFNKATLDIKAYQRLLGPVVGAVAIRSGVIKEYGESSEVPIFERFFIGGGNSIRGYEERTVGPKDSADNPLGGEHRLGATTEIRFPLFWRFTGAIFADGGQVGFRSNDISISEWKYTTGAGIRLITPVGPLRLDYGYKLNPDENDEDLWRVHFSLGEAF